MSLRPDPMLMRLVRYFYPYKWWMLLIAVILMISAGSSSATATLLGKFTDLGFYQQSLKWVLLAPAALIGVSLVYAGSALLSNVLLVKVTQEALCTLRNDLYEALLHWDSTSYHGLKAGEVCSKFANEATLALRDASASFIVLVRDSFQVLGLLGVLFWHDASLTLVTMLTAPVLVLIMRWMNKRMKRFTTGSQTAQGQVVSDVQEAFRLVRDIKLANTYEAEEKKFEKDNLQLRKMMQKTLDTQSLSRPLGQIIITLMVAVVVSVALIEAQQELLTFGEFVTFLTALLLLKTPISRLTNVSATLSTVSATARSLFEMLDRPQETDQGTHTQERVEKGIRFDNVAVTYHGSDSPAVKNVSFAVSAGEHVAIVGASGSGKSTLVNALMRYLRVSEGVISIDGVDIQDWSLASLRENIAYVSQSAFFFDDTVRANVLYGLSDITEEELIEALKAAEIWDEIQTWPQGLDTAVGENASKLSGGERQRLAIARAVLKNASIVLLDEATSALDSETEEKVTRALTRLIHGKTCISIAHRFSSIRGVDRLIVMQTGLIAEIGTQQKLLSRKDGVYRHLYELQTLE